MLFGELKDDTYTIKEDTAGEELTARELAYKLREEELAHRQLRCLFMDLIETILDRVNIRP